MMEKVKQFNEAKDAEKKAEIEKYQAEEEEKRKQWMETKESRKQKIEQMAQELPAQRNEKIKQMKLQTCEINKKYPPKYQEIEKNYETKAF